MADWGLRKWAQKKVRETRSWGEICLKEICLKDWELQSMGWGQQKKMGLGQQWECGMEKLGWQEATHNHQNQMGEQNREWVIMQE